MSPAEAAAQAVIQATFGTSVLYTGAGLTGGSVVAIRSDSAAASFQGFEGNAARISFEIEKALLPQQPRKGNLIVESDGSRWSVIDTDLRRDLGAWVLTVEEAE